MHPQELMDLPYAGMAEKELRKRRLWRLSPHEKIENAVHDIKVTIDMAQNAVHDIEVAIDMAQNAVHDIEKEWNAVQ